MPNADRLRKVIAACDPSQPVPRDLYVERPNPLSRRLRNEIAHAASARVLLVGPPGVGKSTELIRFQQEAAREYTVVRPPLDTHLDLSIVSWHDLLIFTVLWAGDLLGLSQAKELQQLSDMLRAPEPRTAGFIEGGMPLLTPAQRFRNDHGKVQKMISIGPAQCWDVAAAALAKLEKSSGKPLVMLLDGLEKMGPDGAKQLYYHDGRYLRQFPCRMIVTAPLAMSFEPYFGDIEESFFMIERLRASATSEGQPGFDFFREIARRRGADEVMSPELLKDAIAWGGGLPRQFLQLLATAMTHAAIEGQSEVDAEAVTRARLRVTERWQYQLEPKDITSLGLPDTKRERGDRARLLRLGALVEYEMPDGTLKLDPNPLVAALLERRIHDELRGRG
ncbi:MAG: hypothetical protein HUU21_01240 [Polyangiaceae bacterium]|nr:hypothetical protein [Polyangiaceae bacterium]